MRETKWYFAVIGSITIFLLAACGSVAAENEVNAPKPSAYVFGMHVG